MAELSDRCELTDLLVDQCAHCTGRDGGEAADAARKAELLTRPGIVEAMFPGACSDCGEYFATGEPIQISNDAGWKNIAPTWRASCCIRDGAS